MIKNMFNICYIKDILCIRILRVLIVFVSLVLSYGSSMAYGFPTVVGSPKTDSNLVSQNVELLARFTLDKFDIANSHVLRITNRDDVTDNAGIGSYVWNIDNTGFYARTINFNNIPDNGDVDLYYFSGYYPTDVANRRTDTNKGFSPLTVNVIPVQITEAEAMTFTITNSDDRNITKSDGTIVNFQWIVDDQIIENQNSELAFGESGEHTITFNVADDKGDIADLPDLWIAYCLVNDTNGSVTTDSSSVTDMDDSQFIETNDSYTWTVSNDVFNDTDDKSVISKSEIGKLHVCKLGQGIWNCPANVTKSDSTTVGYYIFYAGFVITSSDNKGVAKSDNTIASYVWTDPRNYIWETSNEDGSEVGDRYVWIVTKEAGPYTVTLVVTDSDGSELVKTSLNVTYEWSADNHDSDGHIPEGQNTGLTSGDHVITLIVKDDKGDITDLPELWVSYGLVNDTNGSVTTDSSPVTDMNGSQFMEIKDSYKWTVSNDIFNRTDLDDKCIISKSEVGKLHVCSWDMVSGNCPANFIKFDSDSNGDSAPKVFTEAGDYNVALTVTGNEDFHHGGNVFVDYKGVITDYVWTSTYRGFTPLAVDGGTSTGTIDIYKWFIDGADNVSHAVFDVTVSMREKINSYPEVWVAVVQDEWLDSSVVILGGYLS